MSERNGVTFSDSATCGVSLREAVDGQGISEQIEGLVLQSNIAELLRARP